MNQLLQIKIQEKLYCFNHRLSRLTVGCINEKTYKHNLTGAILKLAKTV